MSPDWIQQLIEKGESETVAFVRDAGDLDRIAATACALLNGMGGIVLCGVDAKGTIAGSDNAKKRVADIREYLQTQLTPQGALLSVSEEHGGLLSIEIPVGQDTPYVYNGAVYLRSGSHTHTATADELRRLIRAESSKPQRWERQPSIAMIEDNLNQEEIAQTVTDAERSGRFQFSTPRDTRSVLNDLGLVQGENCTNAADILFAANPARRHPQIRVRATCFAEDKDSSTFLDDAIFEGPLVTMLQEGLVPFIRRNLRISVSFGDNLQTDDRADYPLEAVREGLVNALAHRDYASFSGGVAVRLYPTRLEIWNSGRLPDELAPKDLKQHHSSIPINPDIVHVLYLRGVMNRIGRGTQTIVNLAREWGLPEPRWTSDTSGVTLTLFAATHPAGGSTFNARQQALLHSLSAGEEIRPSEYQERFAADVSERHARRDLQELINANLLERLGGGPGSRYRRTDRPSRSRNRT